MTEIALVWARLFDGRLWHIAENPEATWCGKSLEVTDARRPERIGGAPPGNGWVCDRCVRLVHQVATDALAVWRGDPRRRAGDRLPSDPDQVELEVGTDVPTEITGELEVDIEQETDH